MRVWTIIKKDGSIWESNPCRSNEALGDFIEKFGSLAEAMAMYTINHRTYEKEFVFDVR